MGRQYLNILLFFASVGSIRTFMKFFIISISFYFAVTAECKEGTEKPNVVSEISLD